MPFSSVEDFIKTENPSKAELALIAACRAGVQCILPPGTADDAATLPPDGPITDDRHIRAALLRLLIIGGTPDCGLHPLGIWLEGAQITEILNLQFTKTRGRLVLDKCRFSAAPQLDQAEIAQLSLEDSHLPGLSAQGIVVAGDIFLRNLTADGTVDVNGAKIGGQLACEGATLNGAGGKALNAQGVQVGDGLFLRSLTATGTVSVAGAKIGGQLACDGATLNGGTDAEGRQQLALNAQRLHVAQGFVFRDLKSVTGQVYLDAAHVGDLVDDSASWRLAEEPPYLNGFTYDRIGGPAPLTLAARKVWLAQGSRYNGTFHPQPYTQFARVLREMGHAAEARKVLMAGQQEASLHDRALQRTKRKLAKALRKFSQAPSADRLKVLQKTGQDLPGPIEAFAKASLATYKALHLPQVTLANAPAALPEMTMQFARQDFRNQMGWVATKARLRIAGSWVKDIFLRRVIGYGHAPHRAIYAMLAVILPGAVFFHFAYDNGAMVPNSDVILSSSSWWWAMLFDTDAPTLVWDDGGTAKHYETFYALAYAFDVFVPLVDLGQQAAWSATTVNWLGWSARVLTMALEVTGWIITALAAASITGLVQKNQPD